MSTLYIIATPIGNLEDVTQRAVRVLGEVDALACEDTRRTRVLLEHYAIPKPGLVIPCHEHNENRVRDRILALLDAGKTVGLCSDAGMPCVSDPGYLTVSAALAAGHTVVAVPGAGAVETALVAAGLPSSSYTFKGFPPRKGGRRRRFLEQERDLPHTMVFFESPYRVARLLADARDAFGNRAAAVCIELTKKFERVHRGFLDDLLTELGERTIKGEVTVVIAGNHPRFRRDGDSNNVTDDDRDDECERDDTLD